jgi:hypothetical protein
MGRNFEYVLVDSPALASITHRPDDRAFEEHFLRAGEKDLVVAFPSLGRYCSPPLSMHNVPVQHQVI